MKIKGIIAIDLDGTLLDLKGRYSIATRDYLRSLTEQGYQIVLASGRPFRAMASIYEDLHCNSPIIAYNGAYVFHPLDPSFPTLKRPFDAKTIQTVYQKTRHIAQSFMAESLENIYVDQRDEYLNNYFPYANMNLHVGPLDQTVSEEVFTCLFRSDVADDSRIKEAVDEVEGISWRAWGSSLYSELFIPDAHKGTALSFVMEALGVSHENVYAFGDATNDIPLLSVAGHPFAMKNSHAKEMFDLFPSTKKTVDEDGVIDELKNCLN